MDSLRSRSTERFSEQPALQQRIPVSKYKKKLEEEGEEEEDDDDMITTYHLQH